MAAPGSRSGRRRGGVEHHGDAHDQQPATGSAPPGLYRDPVSGAFLAMPQIMRKTKSRLLEEDGQDEDMEHFDEDDDDEDDEDEDDEDSMSPTQRRPAAIAAAASLSATAAVSASTSMPTIPPFIPAASASIAASAAANHPSTASSRLFAVTAATVASGGGAAVGVVGGIGHGATAEAVGQLKRKTPAVAYPDHPYPHHQPYGGNADGAGMVQVTPPSHSPSFFQRSPPHAFYQGDSSLSTSATPAQFTHPFAPEVTTSHIVAAVPVRALGMAGNSHGMQGNVWVLFACVSVLWHFVLGR
jgi:hypothetical protein